MPAKVSSSASLAVRLFGPPALHIDDCPVRPLRTRKGYALFALLALRSGRTVERDWLAGTLWPDSAPEHALSGLRRALTDLRDALGDAAECIAAPTARTLQCDLPPTTVDVLRFDSLLARANGQVEPRREAVALYRGPLLEDCADDWLMSERMARAEEYRAALRWLANWETTNGAFANAAAHLRRLILLDPFDEAAHRSLMQALIQAGNPAAMVQVFRDLRVYLRREGNTEPSAETVDFFRQLRAMPPAPTRHILLPPTVAPLSQARNPTVESSAPQCHLPRPLTTFVGREAEIARVTARLLESRLLTLTGPGGVGKTQLSLQIGERAHTQFPGGAWFADLSPVRSPEGIVQAIASALDIAEAPGHDLLKTVIDRLQARDLLLIIDNSEHLIETVAELCTTLLAACPQIRLLVTSRQSLQISGETVFVVPPLTLNTEKGDGEALELFALRARAGNPTFQLTPQNLPLATALCCHLDGLPLAIELAAARLNALSLAELVAHLSDRFDLLTSGARTAQPRQRTLRAMMEWSYALLTSAEKQLLRRLSVFAGQMDSETIHAVCAEADTPKWQTLATLAELIDKSLLLFDGEHYRLLETVREYAKEQLQLSGEQGMLRVRHLTVFLSLAEAAGKQLKGPDAADWARRMEAAHNDLRAALADCSIEQTAMALRLAAALAPYWQLRGHLTEGRQQMRRVRERFPAQTDEAEAALIHVLNGAGLLASRQGDYPDAEVCFAEKMALCEKRGDREGVANTLGNLGNIAFCRCDYATAKQYFDKCLPLFREKENRTGIATATMNLGNIAFMQEDFAAAGPLLAESLALWRILGNPMGMANVLHNLGSAAQQEGNYEKARPLLEEALALRRQLNHRQGIAYALINLHGILLKQNDPRCARAAVAEAWTILHDLGDTVGQASVLRCAGDFWRYAGQDKEAVTCFAAMVALNQSLNIPLLPPAEEKTVGELQAALAPDAFAACWEAGSKATPATLMQTFLQ